MRCLIGIAAVIAAFPASAWAAPADPQEAPGAPTPPQTFMDHAPLPDADMDGLRGGFEVAGVNITLGAQLNTYLNGQLVLATTLNWTSTGANSVTTASSTLTPATAATLQSVIAAGGTFGAMSAGAQAFVANGGQTLLYQNTANGLQNVLVNTAPSVNATQTVNATVGLSGYAGFNGANLASSLGQTLGAAVGAAGIH